jgi:integrase
MSRPRGTGSIYQPVRSPFYWLKYYRNGFPVRESTKTSNVKKAERLLQRRLGEIGTGTFAGPQVERVRVVELAESFLRDYRTNGRKSLDDAEARWGQHLKKHFGQLRAVEVSSDVVSKYIESRLEGGAANATVNRELAALRRMFRLGLRATPPKVLRVPFIPKLAERNVRVGFLEDSQYEKLKAECAKVGMWLLALLEVGYIYGWRIGELLAMRVSQVDVVSGVIRLEPGTTKNDDGREVQMTDRVRHLLRECVRGKSAVDHVFTRTDGTPVRDFRDQWRRVCADVGLPHLLFHDLRRTAARNLRRAGVAEGVIMKIGGWKTRCVFERYAIVSQSDIRDAMAKLQNRHSFGHTDGHTAEKEAQEQKYSRPN